MILETERLYLRELRKEDRTALCEMLQDAEVMYAYEHALTSGSRGSWSGMSGTVSASGR